MYLSNKILFSVAVSVLLLAGCEGNFLSENPKDEVSESIFWKTKEDAHRALIGCYRTNKNSGGSGYFNGWNSQMAHFSHWTDISVHARFGARPAFPESGILPTNGEVHEIWNYNYKQIACDNYFLGNVNKVSMDENEKKEMVAEVKFLRAYAYFWLSQLYGNVPLIKEILTFDGANSVNQSSQEEVVKFALNELTEAAKNLPVERPSSEQGRIEKGAALALKGRFLMADQQWDDAAKIYKRIIDLNRYSIDPRFKELFEEKGDGSPETIFVRQYKQGPQFGEYTSFHMIVGTYGGTTSMQYLQNFVDKFLMKDGKSIDNSPLYDPEHPFKNRDSRLYATVLLPGYSKVDGEIYDGRPETIDKSGQTGPGVTGYSMNKFWDHDYEGNIRQYGANTILIRYAEVLLSYLESKLKAGDNVTQSLLDKTINKVREREAVQMAPVTETNPKKLMEIIRNERVVEFANEGGIRYWDLNRWDLAKQIIGRTFYGLKITDNPKSYSGKYEINDEGHIYIRKKIFKDYNSLWPIPQSELDINSNLKQNPGY